MDYNDKSILELRGIIRQRGMLRAIGAKSEDAARIKGKDALCVVLRSYDDGADWQETLRAILSDNGVSVGEASPRQPKPEAPKAPAVKRESKPAAPKAPSSDNAADQLAGLIRTLATGSPLDEEAVRRIVAEEVGKLSGVNAVVINDKATGKTKVMAGQHKAFNELLLCVSVRVNVWLTGPAGSGKTTGAEKTAEALGLPFYFCGAIADEFKLLGFKDASGQYHRTPFREAFENGGVFLFDEVDASGQGALLAFNAALANNYCDFADGIVRKHPDFVCIAAANTFGLGGTAEYVGRMKQDAAFLDRFAQLEWGYDADLEKRITPNEEWTRYVQQVRKRAKDRGLKVIVSPRASIYGAKLIAAGMTAERAAELTIKKGMSADHWEQIKG